MAQQDAVRETMDAINAACRSGGGGYSCKQVSWDDVQRGTVDGSLSCWGGNITDTRLYEKSGTLLYTVRSDNWNEKLGRVDSDGVAIVVGNHKPPAREGDPIQLKPITLTNFLKNTGLYANYAGVNGDTSLFNEVMDREVSIRFQTTFLPVSSQSGGALEFCAEAYNYNTTSDGDPRNAVLLCTTQGIAFQQDGAGAKKLFHHAIEGRSGAVQRYWLEAERTKHRVGGAQMESTEEAKNAAARGKATASVIGTEAMGTRFNVLMTIQIPLEKKEPEPRYGYYYSAAVSAVSAGHRRCCGGGIDEGGRFDVFGGDESLEYDDEEEDVSARLSGGKGWEQQTGTSNAARVSRGTMEDTWDGVGNKTPKRDVNQHVTVTVVIYNMVTGGVPSTEDVNAAIDDMEQLYEACHWTGRLDEVGADFMKSEVTVAEASAIKKKIAHQPYKVAPVCGLVESGNIFPTSSK